MPITMQCDKSAEGATDVSKLHGYPEGQVIVRTIYAGCVLDKWERNGYDDSDFFALVWNEETQATEVIEYATTRGWTYANGATIDATPEVIAKATAYKIKQATAKYVRSSMDEALEPSKGKVCRVVKGRKVAKGSVVTVLGEPQRSVFGYNNETFNVLVRLADGSMLKTNVKNLEVTNPEQYHMTEAAAAQQAERAVKNSNWRSMPYIGISKRLANALARVL